MVQIKINFAIYVEYINYQEANLVEYLLENRSDFEWSIDLEEEDEDEKEL